VGYATEALRALQPEPEEVCLVNASWVNGAEAVAPGALTQLVKVVTTAGKIGRVYGFRVVSQEANAAGKVWRLRASVQGQTVNLALADVTNPTFTADVDAELGIVKGNGADFFEVVNVVAGTAATIHQASILYEERDS
jgi:hypothetical protein